MCVRERGGVNQFERGGGESDSKTDRQRERERKNERKRETGIYTERKKAGGGE